MPIVQSELGEDWMGCVFENKDNPWWRPFPRCGLQAGDARFRVYGFKCSRPA